jgi:prepilin-type N-terminal cleavage/methylation domain-containing protein
MRLHPHPAAGGRSPRGFTIAEAMAVLVILSVILVLLVQTATWVLRERLRSTDQQAAQELAANVLEAARARAWNDLTPEWAAGQRLPEPYAQRGWKLQVHVEPEKSRPRTRRVTVAVQWRPEQAESSPVQLVGLFGARSTPKTGGQP